MFSTDNHNFSHANRPSYLLNIFLSTPIMTLFLFLCQPSIYTFPSLVTFIFKYSKFMNKQSYGFWITKVDLLIIIININKSVRCWLLLYLFMTLYQSQNWSRKCAGNIIIGHVNKYLRHEKSLHRHHQHYQIMSPMRMKLIIPLLSNLLSKYEPRNLICIILPALSNQSNTPPLNYPRIVSI